MNNYFCTNSGQDCSCQHPCQQSCQPPCPPPPPQPPASCSCCPCNDDFRRALDLICSPRLQPLVNFNTFSFVTDYYVLGTAMTVPEAGATPSDNLDAPAGAYFCGGGNCEALSVSGTLYPPEAAGTALATTVSQVALCRLNALSFDAAAGTEGAAANFQTISQTLGQLLRPKRPQDCGSLADTLTNAAAIRASTVTAGPLVVQNSTILGQLGNILVMANSTDNRFYFLCTNRIDFMG